MHKHMPKAQLEALATGICGELGSGWTVKPCSYEHVVKIGDEAGHVLNLNSSWDGPGRLSITGDYPKDENNSCYGRSVIRYNGNLPRITVAETKTAKAIAGDIKRRLLPEYLDIHAKAMERKAAADKYTASQLSVLDQIEALGFRVNRKSMTFDFYASGEGYINNGQASSDSVQMDLRSIPLTKALAILKILNSNS